MSTKKAASEVAADLIIITLMKRFSTEETARDLLESIR